MTLVQSFGYNASVRRTDYTGHMPRYTRGLHMRRAPSGKNQLLICALLLCLCVSKTSYQCIKFAQITNNVVEMFTG